MANRSGMAREGRGEPRQPLGTGLDAPGEDDGPENHDVRVDVRLEALDGLRASIAERLHTQTASPPSDGGSKAPRSPSARRRRR